MNKKILFLILLGVLVLPLAVLADNGQACTTINAFTKLAGNIGVAIVVIGWVITGVLYLTAGGAPEKTGIAKKALIACVIGTVVIVLASGAMGFVKDAFQINEANLIGC